MVDAAKAPDGPWVEPFCATVVQGGHPRSVGVGVKDDGAGGFVMDPGLGRQASVVHATRLRMTSVVRSPKLDPL